jgi:hypothetical protein
VNATHTVLMVIMSLDQFVLLVTIVEHALEEEPMIVHLVWVTMVPLISTIQLANNLVLAAWVQILARFVLTANILVQLVIQTTKFAAAVILVICLQANLDVSPPVPLVTIKIKASA